MQGFFIDAVLNAIFAIILYIIYVIFVILAVPICTRWVKPTWIRGLLRFFIIAFMVSLPFYEVIFAEKWAEYKEKTVTERKKHLFQACQTEAKITINKKISANSGIFVTQNEERKYRLPNNEEHYHDCVTSLYNKIMIEETGSYCREKYVYPISWVRSWWADTYVRKHLKPAYVEGIEPKWKNNGKNWQQWAERYLTPMHELITDDGYQLKKSFFTRVGTIHWWKTSEQKEIFAQWTKDYPLDGKNDDEFVAIPVMNLVAPYRLVSEDISTWEDRDKGIRRGRLALEDRKTNEVLSEYISFDTVPWRGKYTYNPFSSSRFTCLNVVMKNTENTEKISVFDDFLRQVVEDTK